MLAYSNSEAYSEPCQISTMMCFAKVVNDYNYFRKLFSQYKLAAFSTEVVIIYKKLRHARGPGTVNFSNTHWYIQIN